MTAQIGDKWHTLLNKLENHFRSRVINLRTKLGEILEKGGTEDQMTRLIHGPNNTGEFKLEELIREGFSLNQEETLEEFQKLLFAKESALSRAETTAQAVTSDYHRVRKKYQKLKADHSESVNNEKKERQNAHETAELER